MQSSSRADAPPFHGGCCTNQAQIRCVDLRWDGPCSGRPKIARKWEATLGSAANRRLSPTAQNPLLSAPCAQQPPCHAWARPLLLVVDTDNKIGGSGDARSSRCAPHPPDPPHQRWKPTNPVSVDPSPAHWAGLTPTVRSSDGKARLGRISRQGSPALRWALVEAAQKSTTGGDRLREHFERITERRGPKLADRARAEEWSYEQFAAALLKTETDSRDSHGGQARIKAARFPRARRWRSSTSPSRPRSPSTPCCTWFQQADRTGRKARGGGPSVHRGAGPGTT